MVRHHHATESSLVDLFLPLSNTRFSQVVIEVFPQTYSLPRLRINRTLKCDFTNRSVFSIILNCYKFYLATLSQSNCFPERQCLWKLLLVFTCLFIFVSLSLHVLMARNLSRATQYYSNCVVPSVRLEYSVHVVVLFAIYQRSILIWNNYKLVLTRLRHQNMSIMYVGDCLKCSQLSY